MEVINEKYQFIFKFQYQGTIIDGWYVREFLGKTGNVDYQALKSGLNAVPLIITNGERYYQYIGTQILIMLC